jgi:hypothetical protein
VPLLPQPATHPPAAACRLPVTAPCRSAEASAKGEFVRTYLLADVKAKALALHGSWEKLTGKKAGLRDMLDKFKQVGRAGGEGGWLQPQLGGWL